MQTSTGEFSDSVMDEKQIEFGNITECVASLDSLLRVR